MTGPIQSGVRVVILVDAVFASREREMLLRLEVGLADEGVRVVHAVPSEAPDAVGAGVYSASLRFAGRGLPFTTGVRARRFAERLEEVDSSGHDRKPDLVHVFGGALWPFAAALGEACDTPVIYEVWRAGLADRAAGMSASDQRRALFLAPDTAIERTLRDRRLPARLAPWGVHAPDEPASRLRPDRAPTFILIGAGNDPRSMQNALEGLAALVPQQPDLLIFADALAARRAGLYAHAQRLRMLHNLSLIEEIESRRDLLVQGDVLVLGEALGEQRTVVLEAMAHSMIVVAAEDRDSNVLLDGATARLVRTRTPAAWAQSLQQILSDPVEARRLGESARRFVVHERRASDQVRHVLEAYATLIPRADGRTAVP